ncbi:MAG: hypothetical protein IKE30_05965, partial [Clostridia bacterium]|nr:hypothetical protein [Clostridia bacterium]
MAWNLRAADIPGLFARWRELGMETPLRGVSIPCFQIFLRLAGAAGKSAGKPFLLSAASCLRKNGSAVWRSHTCGMTQREHPLQSCDYLSLRGRC